MKIVNVDFPEPLLNALRNGRLVVFAGAGVSMGPRAGLPSFRRLAEQVAEGTGQSIGNEEAEDRFLGRLKDRGTNVHQRAAQILQRNDPEPTALHRNLLRFYGQPEDLLVVTTNLDALFELAAVDEFESEPRLFHAPALPLASSFRGIVHLHGSVDEPEEMVLTHRDFGRAYLTEIDGWARRFVVHLFTNYTVLFVGYSHSDTIMTYLTPSLPPDDEPKRFALVGSQNDEGDHWYRMGIEPVAFHQANANDFSGLDAAVAGLANLIQRRVLDWQREIAAIASVQPPIDDESAGIIEHTLTIPELTRLFVEAAKSPEWVGWLDRRGHLNRVFAEGDLEERDEMLSYWLATQFTITHADELFSTIARHGGRLNVHLWNRLAWTLSENDEATLDATILSRWVHFLMSSVPPQIDDFTLLRLAETCANLREVQNLLQVYDAMTTSRYQIRPPSVWDASLNRHIRRQMFWERCLEPNLPHIAHSLLERTTMRLEERRSAMKAWGDGTETWDHDSHGRSAIEPHSQDGAPHHIDALINVARGCLDWLATNDPLAAGAWSDRFVGSDAPLLCRLSIHTISARTDLSSDEKIAWLLDRCDVNQAAVRHEIFRAFAAAYPNASVPARSALIQAVLEYRAQRNEWLDLDSETITAHYHHNWFHWLHEADPDCAIAKKALNDILARHPEFVPREHADFTLWSQEVSGKSPWTVEELLARPAVEWLPELLVFEPTGRERAGGVGRWEMLQTIGEAVRSDSAWGIDLADAMVNGNNWNNDLWPQILMAWTKAGFQADELPRLLRHLSTEALQTGYAGLIADALCHFVQHASNLVSAELLLEANSVATTLQPYAAMAAVPDSMASVGGVPDDMGWLYKAINHPTGKLAEYWVHSIALWRRQQTAPPETLGVEYRSALDAILGADGVISKLGRTVLAGRLHILLASDEAWTLDNLLPFFDIDNNDFQCAWDGFLTWGNLSPSTAERLRDSLIRAVQRIDLDFNHDMLMRFVEYYVAALGWLINDANDAWIIEFFLHATPEVKRLFAWEIGHRTRNLDEPSQQEWWNIWLKDYWSNRLQGVPSPLDAEEIAEMLQWVMHLTGVFPEAVELAVKMRPEPIGDTVTLHDIGESDLIDRYPNDLAKFLVHLGKYEAPPWLWLGTREVVDRLLAKGLPADIDQNLRELIVRRDLR